MRAQLDMDDLEEEQLDRYKGRNLDVTVEVLHARGLPPRLVSEVYVQARYAERVLQQAAARACCVAATSQRATAPALLAAHAHAAATTAATAATADAATTTGGSCRRSPCGRRRSRAAA